MKRQYEKNELLFFSSIIFIIVVILFLVFLINKRVVLYRQFNGIVSKENILEFILTDEELKLFYKNKIIYIDNKKYKFKIARFENDVVEREGKKYNYVYIKTNISNLLKVNDVVKISIMEKSIKSINIFKIIWGGDLNKENR